MRGIKGSVAFGGQGVELSVVAALLFPRCFVFPR